MQHSATRIGALARRAYQQYQSLSPEQRRQYAAISHSVIERVQHAIRVAQSSRGTSTAARPAANPAAPSDSRTTQL